jgi:multiple sugar transport system ATP-binding protein
VRLGDGIVLDAPSSTKAAPGQKVVLGVRPEHLRPTTGAGVSATINVLEPTGPETHIYAKVGNNEVCAITNEYVDMRAGSPITLTFPAERAHLFDAASGAALRG